MATLSYTVSTALAEEIKAMTAQQGYATPSDWLKAILKAYLTNYRVAKANEGLPVVDTEVLAGAVERDLGNFSKGSGEPTS